MKNNCFTRTTACQPPKLREHLWGSPRFFESSDPPAKTLASGDAAFPSLPSERQRPLKAWVPTRRRTEDNSTECFLPLFRWKKRLTDEPFGHTLVRGTVRDYCPSLGGILWSSYGHHLSNLEVIPEHDVEFTCPVVS